MQVEDFTLHHVSSLELAECPAFSCVEDSEESSSGAVLDKMLPIVYRTMNGLTHKTRTSQEPLFTVAMEMKLDKERNSTVGYSHSHLNANTV